MKRLRLAPRVFIATSALLLFTVLVTSVTLLYQTSTALRDEAQQYAEQLAGLLASNLADKGEISLANVFRTIDATLNGPMAAQGHIAAYFVAAAAEAGYDTTRVVDILTTMIDETVLDEFWITDEEAYAYLTNVRYATGPDAGELWYFAFSPDPAVQPQASKFYSLLHTPTDSAAVITQPAQVREIDGRTFKYVGVGGVDHHRIVQVGNELEAGEQEILRRISSEGRADVSLIIEGILGQQLATEGLMLDHFIRAAEDASWSASRIDEALARLVAISDMGEIRITDARGAGLYSSLDPGDSLRATLAHAAELDSVLDGTLNLIEHGTAMHERGTVMYKYVTSARPGSGRIIQIGIPIESSSGNLLYSVYQEEARVAVENGLPRGLWIYNQSLELAAFASYQAESGEEESALGRDIPESVMPLLDQAMQEEHVVSAARLALRSPQERGIWAASPIINVGEILIGGMVFFVNLDAIAETVRAEARRTAMIALFLLSLTAIATFFGARLLTRPIEVIAEAAREVESGEQPDSVLMEPVANRSDEIGSLARVFLDMSAQVFNREEVLETLVSERTQELQTSNHKLRRAQEAINQDLEMAKIVQAALVREGTVQIKAFSACARMNPAQRVGGDFVDFLEPEEGKLFVAIGDVSGKGVAAALFMAASQAAVKFAVAERIETISAIADEANRRLCSQNPMGLFVTTFLAMVNLKNGTIDYVSAGHEPPYILGSNGLRKTLPPTGGLAMGLMEDFPYSSGTTVLQPGETLFLYTDGLTDMVNIEGEIFGRERLEETIDGTGGHSPEEIVNQVWTTIGSFATGAPAADDMTCLVLHRKNDIA